MNEVSMVSETAQCEKHGSYELKKISFLGREMTRRGCPKCANEADEKQSAEAAAMAELKRVVAWKKKVDMALIPDRFINRTLDTFVADTDRKRHALEFAKAYAADFESISEVGKGAIFIGKPGTGKTHLSVGIALDVMSNGYTAIFLTVMRAMRRIKDSWAKGAEYSETEAIESMVFPDLLILDEVGVQFGSDTEKLLLFEVLNERYEQRKPTLLLSNLALEDVRLYLGERVFDRMREDGGEVVVFDWESHRGKACAA